MVTVRLACYFCCCCCSGLSTLSLGDSLLRSWRELCLILRCCPNLKTLCLAGTRLDSFQSLLQQAAAAAVAAANDATAASPAACESTTGPAAATQESSSRCLVADAVERLFIEKHSQETPATGGGTPPAAPVAIGDSCCPLESLSLDSTFISWPDVREKTSRSNLKH